MLYYTIPYYTILYHTIIYYTILYHAILYFTRPYYTIIYYVMLYYTVPCYTIVYHTIIYYTILYHTILYYAILYDSILYYAILYYIILYYNNWMIGNYSKNIYINTIWPYFTGVPDRGAFDWKRPSLGRRLCTQPWHRYSGIAVAQLWHERGTVVSRPCHSRVTSWNRRCFFTSPSKIVRH